MSKVNFSHASQRWYKLMEEESQQRKAEEHRSGTVLSWEALDHLCGLAVESSMKALMLKEKWVEPEKSTGDYPKDSNGRRPHVNELWEIFVSKAKGRTAGAWIARLSEKKDEPVSVFAEWRAEHRYAPDATVSRNVLQARLAMAARLKRIAQEEGIL